MGQVIALKSADKPANLSDSKIVTAAAATYDHASIEMYEPAPATGGSKCGTSIGDIAFQFNPKELTISKSAKWERQPAKGAKQAGPPEYSGAEPCRLTVEMFFDATLAHRDTVVESVEKLFSCCVPLDKTISDNKPMPPLVVFKWGNVTSFPAFVTQVNARYTRFATNGVPVRAVCTVNLEEMPADSGRLKQTALVLRRALEGAHSRRTGWHYILERGGTYYFNTQVAYQCDLEDFEQELQHAYADRQAGEAGAALAHFQRAFALRRSELLPEFRYDDWASSHGVAEREQYLQALEDAARLHGARGDHARAIELLKRAAREDPLRESSAQQLMEWLSLKRDKTEALRVYTRLRNHLATKLQLEPNPVITALYHAIRSDHAVGDLNEPGLSAAS